MPYNPNRDPMDRPMDYGRDYGSGRDYGYSSARTFEAAGELDDGRRGRGDRDRDRGRPDRDTARGGRDYYGGRTYGSQNDRSDSREQWHGSYGSGGRHFEDVGRYRDADDDNRGNGRPDRAPYGRAPQGYDYEDRGFINRAGDEVRSWFGDEDAERRREMDSRYDERAYHARDDDYHSWRRGQIDALDRDYAEYRSEHRDKFHNEFSTWRTERQGQRGMLAQIKEHMEVLGSDGAHVGTVDKVRGDRILLTKNDKDAGGHHHTIPSRWVQTVADKVTLTKTAKEAQDQWQEEDNARAMFGDNTRDDKSDTRNLNRSFSGTY